jgi:hypothetical protein
MLGDDDSGGGKRLKFFRLILATTTKCSGLSGLIELVDMPFSRSSLRLCVAIAFNSQRFDDCLGTAPESALHH